jgi:hypothetical protein
MNKIILDGTGATWGNTVWPIWLGVAVTVFLGFEIWALKTNAANTLSAWVWRSLQISRNQSPLQWGASDYLTFGVWLVLFTWLTFHFFFGRFT